MNKLFTTVETDRDSTDIKDIMELDKQDELEFITIMDSLQVAREAGEMVDQNIVLLEDTLANGTVSKELVLSSNLILNNAKIMVGDDSLVSMSMESIYDPNESLTVSLEEQKKFVMKVLININKTFARLKNILLKYLSRLSDLLIPLVNDLNSTINVLKVLKNKDIKLTHFEVTDENILAWQAMKFMGLLGLEKMNDPFTNASKIVKVYGNPNFIDDAVEVITTSMSSEGKPKQIYESKSAIKILKSNVFNKLSGLLCKNGKDDNVVIGSTNSKVWFLSRCKLLHITNSVMPYKYSIKNIKFDVMSVTGNSVIFKVPDIDVIIDVLEDAKKIAADGRRIENKVHAILKIGSKEIAKIDEEVKWESIGIYGQLPQLLLILSKTYFNLPTSLDGLGKVYLQNLKSE